MLRRVLLVAVAVVGALAVTATSLPLSEVFADDSAPKTLTVVLDEAQPALDFTVVVRAATPGSDVSLRAGIIIDDDGEPDNDGVALVDVGLLPVGELLPADVNAVGDASMAAVAEGEFGISAVLGFDELGGADGARRRLAVRLRDGIARARVTFVLIASRQVSARDDVGTLVVDVTPGAPE